LDFTSPWVNSSSTLLCRLDERTGRQNLKQRRCRTASSACPQAGAEQATTAATSRLLDFVLDIVEEFVPLSGELQQRVKPLADAVREATGECAGSHTGCD
jgi:hypothetical protein